MKNEHENNKKINNRCCFKNTVTKLAAVMYTANEEGIKTYVIAKKTFRPII
jgi:hypothetical protein